MEYTNLTEKVIKHALENGDFDCKEFHAINTFGYINAIRIAEQNTVGLDLVQLSDNGNHVSFRWIPQTFRGQEVEYFEVSAKADSICKTKQVVDKTDKILKEVDASKAQYLWVNYKKHDEDMEVYKQLLIEM